MKERIVQKGIWDSKWADPNYISKHCETREQKRAWLASVPLPGVEPGTTQRQAQPAADSKQNPERKTPSSNQIPSKPVTASSKQDSMPPVATRSKGGDGVRADSASLNVATKDSVESSRPKSSAPREAGPAKPNPFNNPVGYEHLSYDLDAYLKASRVGDTVLAERTKNGESGPKAADPAKPQSPQRATEGAKSGAEALQRIVQAVKSPQAFDEPAQAVKSTSAVWPIQGTPGLANSKWADVPASQQSSEIRPRPAEQPAKPTPVKDEAKRIPAVSRWVDVSASPQSSERPTKAAEQPSEPQSIEENAKSGLTASQWADQPVHSQPAETLNQPDEGKQTSAPIGDKSRLTASTSAKLPTSPQSPRRSAQPDNQEAPSSQEAAPSTLYSPAKESLAPAQVVPDVPSLTNETGTAGKALETQKLLSRPVTDVTSSPELVDAYRPDWRKIGSPSLISPHWPTPLKAQADMPQSVHDVGRPQTPITRRSSAIVQMLGSELKPLILGLFEEVVRLECQSQKCLAEKAALQRDQARYEAWREIKWSVRDQLEALGTKCDDQADLRLEAILRGLHEQFHEQRSSMKKLIEGQRQQEERMERLAEEVRRPGGKYSRRESKESATRSASAGRAVRTPEYAENADRRAAEPHDSKLRIQELEKEKAEIKKLYFAAVKRPQVGDDHVMTEFNHIFYDFLQFSTGSLQAAGNTHFDMNALPSETKAWLKSYVSPELRAPRVATVPSYIRPYLFMLIMSKTLCEAFRAHNYFGASTAGTVQNAIALANTTRPEREKESRRWLELTRQLIDNQDSTLLPCAEEALIADMVESVKSDFGSTLQVTWTDAAEEKLGFIFTKALDLFRKLHKQEARYFVEMVPAREQTRFDPVTMEDLLSEEMEVEVLREKGVDVAVFPTVYKRGDEFGECESLTTVVCKGRVVLKRK